MSDDVKPGKITFGYLWELAESEVRREEVHQKVYGTTHDNDRRLRGFTRMCELIALFENHERDFLAIVKRHRAQAGTDDFKTPPEKESDRAQIRARS